MSGESRTAAGKELRSLVPGPFVLMWPFEVMVVSFGLVSYTLACSSHGYWLDSGEFIAASVSLGISHPPGHPLAALMGSLLLSLPIGPIPFRVALASSLLAVGAALITFRLVVRVLESSTSIPTRTCAVFATLAALTLLGSKALMFQSVRPEVYALHAVLAAGVLERLHTFSQTARQGTFYHAAVLLGLAGANHHLLALLLTPLFVISFFQVANKTRVATRVRTLAKAAALSLAVALCVYLYLPIRAASGAALNFGNPSTLANFIWTISAKTFQMNVGEAVPGTLSSNLLDVCWLLLDSLGPVVSVLAILGLYLLIRLPKSRTFGLAMLYLLGSHTLLRAYLGFVSHNPDAAGYLVPALLSLIVCAACATVVSLDVVDNALIKKAEGALDKKGKVRVSSARRALRGLVISLAALAFLVPPIASRAESSLSDFKATDTFAEVAYRHLPPRSVLVLHQPQSLFALYGVASVERLRPDVMLVPVPLLHYPGMKSSLLALEPALQRWLGPKLPGPLTREKVLPLRLKRPVLAELDVRMPLTEFRNWEPAGLHFQPTASQLSSAPQATSTVETPASDEVQRDALASAFQTDALATLRKQTRDMALWSLYIAALHAAATERWQEGRRFALEAKRLAPKDRALGQLSTYLKREQPDQRGLRLLSISGTTR